MYINNPFLSAAHPKESIKTGHWVFIKDVLQSIPKSDRIPKKLKFLN